MGTWFISCVPLYRRNLRPDFLPQIHAIAGLAPVQLAEFAVGSDVLHDSEKAGKVFGSLTSQNIGEFMDAFNAAAEQVCCSLFHLDLQLIVIFSAQEKTKLDF